MNQRLIENFSVSELAPYATEAQSMDAVGFCGRYHGAMRLWGHPPNYVAVTVQGTDYLWRIKDGKYDGWDRNMMPEQ